MIQCVNSHSEAISLTWVVKSENHPIMAALLFVHILIQNDQFSFPDMKSFKDLNSSAVVLLVGNKGAHNIPHVYPPKIYISYKNKHHCLIVNIGRLVNLDCVSW